MADLAGAYAAIKQRIIDNWATTPLGFMNEADPVQIDVAGNPKPWVEVEIINVSSDLRGIGTPGNNVWMSAGLILMHVFVPIGEGTALAMQYATALGEIFRAAEFYNATPGHQVRTWAPHVDGGGSASDDGRWWGVTTSVEWQYLYQK